MEHKNTLDELVQAADDRFREKLGRPPRWLVAAPGRVNLIGEHTDYNDGYVLPMAIERYVALAADRPEGDDAASDSKAARVFSTEVDEWSTILVEGPITPGSRGWPSYVQGTVAGCLSAGLAPGGFEAVIHSNVPLGGGLSSSAALEVATATLIEAITGRTLDPLQKIRLCQKAEHEFAGMPCGIMDQFSSVMARRDRLMLLDCRSLDVKMVPLDDPGLTVLIINSNVKHELTGSEYSQRRAECEAAARGLRVPMLRDATPQQLEQAKDRLKPVEYRRARHVVGEIERTTAAAAAIAAGDWPTVGRLMYASHASLRDDYEVSCRELDLLVEIAQSLGEQAGVIGSRMTGGGFGGCTVSLVRADAVKSVADAIRVAYHRQTGIEPTVFASRPAQGAQIVRGSSRSGMAGGDGTREL